MAEKKKITKVTANKDKAPKKGKKGGALTSPIKATVHNSVDKSDFIPF